MENILFSPSFPEDFCLENLENVCRICLQIYPPYLSIFRDHIDEMISEFLPDNVDKRDNFPNQICKKCVEDLKVAYAFKKQTEYSHEVIKNLLSGKRLPRSSRRKIYKELSPSNISTQSFTNKTYFQCHICKKRLKRKDILKRHLERVHKCFEPTEQYNDKINSEEEKAPSENESDDEPLISLLEHVTSDTESETAFYDNNDDFERKQDSNGILVINNERDNSSNTILDVQKEAIKSYRTQLKSINAYVCHICEKEFSCRKTTRQHLKNVHKFHNFEDDIWLSKVYQKTVEAKIYECEMCQKVYARTEDLFRHQLLHSGDPRAKPYCCTMCSKSFSRSNHLKDHISAIHENLRPFKCATCEKSFRRAENWESHSLICLKKDISYVCHICHKHCISLCNLNDHIEKQHEKNDTNDLDIKPNILVLKNSSKNETIEKIESSSVSELLEKNHDYEFASSNKHLEKRPEKNDTDKNIKPEMTVLTNPSENEESEELESSSVSQMLEKKCNSESANLSYEISMINDHQEDNPSVTSLDVRKAEAKQYYKTQPKTINAYVCHICEKEFSCRTTTRRHLKNVHKFENFEDNIWLSKVYKKTIEAKMYECEICLKFYSKTDDLFRHQLSHTGDPRAKPYSCTTCLKSFSRSNHLKNHINEVHENLKPFTCSACGKSFGRSQNLKNHIAICSIEGRIRETAEETFSCEVCFKEFLTEKAVRDHVYLEHDETREFSCKHCSEKIIGSSEYRKHCKDRCIIAKQFLCSECGGRFRKMADLKIHLRRHTGQKPYKCQYCDKMFYRPGDQHAHERLHRGEKNYVCSKCGKAFVTKYKLRNHLRIHTGERPYKCTSCSKDFSEQSNLTKHLKQKHTRERFYCNICAMSYSRRDFLRKHKREVHGVIEPGGQSLLFKIKTEDPEKQLVESNLKTEN